MLRLCDNLSVILHAVNFYPYLFQAALLLIKNKNKRDRFTWSLFPQLLFSCLFPLPPPIFCVPKFAVFSLRNFKTSEFQY